MKDFNKMFLRSSIEILEQIDENEIERIVDILVEVREKRGRLFVIGSGGGAGHASHAVCDFRKLCEIESYAPYDNVSELTARVNDEGWDVTLINWAKISHLNENDVVFVFSVGGGNEEKKISENLVKIVRYAKKLNAKVVGIVGKDGGYTKQVGDAVVVIPVVDEKLITPLTEGFQAMIWHLLIAHPRLQVNAMKWESIKNK